MRARIVGALLFPEDFFKFVVVSTILRSSNGVRTDDATSWQAYVPGSMSNDADAIKRLGRSEVFAPGSLIEH
jgi:hypothetical protein